MTIKKTFKKITTFSFIIDFTHGHICNFKVESNYYTLKVLITDLIKNWLVSHKIKEIKCGLSSVNNRTEFEMQVLF